MTAARKVETVSPPAMLLWPVSQFAVNKSMSDTYTSVDACAVISSWLTSPVLTFSEMFVKKSSRPESAFNLLSQRQLGTQEAPSENYSPCHFCSAIA